MPVTILGVHRSGTSMLSRLLNLGGVFLGDEADLLMARRGNDKGCWEHHVFMDINQQLLARFGGTLEDPPLFPDRWWQDPALRPLRDEAEDFIRYAFGDGEHPMWGWKDPQTTLTYPFWRALLPDLRAVISVRNPLDVAASITVHDEGRASTRKALALWQHYTETALRETAPAERIVVHYEDLLARPRESLARVLAFLDLPPVAPGSPVDDELRRFADTSLRHHGHTLDDVMRSPEVFTVTRLLYEALRHAVDAPEAAQAVDRVFAHPASEEHLTRAWGAAGEEAQREQQRYIGEMARDITWLKTHIGSLQAWVTRQREALDWHEQHSAELERQLEELRAWTAEQQSALDWHAAHREALERQLAELMAQSAQR